jgi:hypothetical protein
MTRVLKILTVAAALVALCGVILSAAYTQTVDEEVTRLRRENRSDIVYLRTRVRELESMLTAELAGRLEPPDLPVDGVPEDTIETAATDEAETNGEEDVGEDTSDTRPEENTDGGTDEDTVGEPDTQLPESEEVTVPTHNSPETAAPTALYTLTAYNGMIGVFDQGGELVRVINVFVMTLPQAEQEALAMGIPAYSEEEMRQIAERFE